MLCTHRPVLPSVYDALGIAREHHATGELVVIHHRHGQVRAVERHLADALSVACYGSRRSVNDQVVVGGARRPGHDLLEPVRARHAEGQDRCRSMAPKPYADGRSGDL